MAKSSFKCTKCSRSFSMPAHLARHMNTIHARKAAKKVLKAKAKRKPGRPKLRKAAARARTVGRPRTVSAAPARAGEGAVGLVRGMQAYHGELMARREQIETEIGAITSALDAMGGGLKAVTVRPKRGRPRGTGPRTGSLKDFIGKVLRQTGRPLSPKDIANTVRKVGYRSKAKDLTKAVSNMLPQMKGVKKVGFGMYRS